MSLAACSVCWTVSSCVLGKAAPGVCPPRRRCRARFGSFPRYNSSKAEKELGINFLPLEQTITDTVARFKDLGVEP